MKSKSIVLIAFILVVIAQLFVPIQMINSQEDVLTTGKTLKFKMAPIDPYDAFRGKFIYLNFANDRIPVNNETRKLKYNDEIFVTFRDSAGYALPVSASKTKPVSTSEYIKAKVDYVDNRAVLKFNSAVNRSNRLYVYFDYPFNRFYMNEDKAPEAEKAYATASRDLKENVYAEVAIKNGIGVVKDVFIDSIPIKDYVEKLADQ
ncbi:MAG: GDYXXLXY domain-containing protein [Flavobacterium sp. JAD_PAG50586_2]|nr:MAG: GDYXXLXY domain-containing protein [Flavobacterium sp. JAD_PAG50586_2]